MHCLNLDNGIRLSCNQSVDYADNFDYKTCNRSRRNQPLGAGPRFFEHCKAVRQGSPLEIEMETQQIANQVQSYLLQLNTVNQQWAEWLENADRLEQSLPIDGLTDFQKHGQTLIDQVANLVSLRERLLSEASQRGMPATNLKSLVDSLPASSRLPLLSSIRSVQSQLEQLRRIHISAWVTLRESAEYCHDSLLLMMSGQTRQDVTIDQMPPETGGHLLSADL